MGDLVDVGTDDAGRLTIGRLDRICLTLHPSGALLSSVRSEPTMLVWDDYGQLPDWMDGKPEPDRWQIGWATSGEHTVRGVAVVAAGTYRDLCEPHVRRWPRWIDWLRRINQHVSAGPRGLRIPLTPDFYPAFAGDDAPLRNTLSCLFEVLSQHAELRSRLDDHDRMRALSADIATRRVLLPTPGGAIGRDAVDVEAALTSAGYRYPYERPLSPSGRPDTEQVVDDVTARLAANPHRAGREIDRKKVRELVVKHLIDIDPWPFAALVDDTM